jgi:rsbT antagonist protein RsbS
MEKLVPDDSVPRVSMQIVQNCLVLSVQVELFDASLAQLRRDLLDNIKTSGVRRAIIDLSAVEIMDPFAYASICDSANMAKVMGANTLLSGIRPGVAAALVDLGADAGRVETTLNLEHGFVRLAELAEIERQDEDQAMASGDAEDETDESPDMIGNDSDCTATELDAAAAREPMP